MAGDVLPVAMFFFLGELPWGTPVISKMDEYLKKKNSKRPLTLIPFRNICCKFCVNMRKLAYTFEAYFGDPSKQITELFGNFPKCLQPSPNLVVCQLFLKLSWVLPARIMSPASCTALSLKYVIVHICILLCICLPFSLFSVLPYAHWNRSVLHHFVSWTGDTSTPAFHPSQKTSTSSFNICNALHMHVSLHRIRVWFAIGLVCHLYLSRVIFLDLNSVDTYSNCGLHVGFPIAIRVQSKSRSRKKLSPATDASSFSLHCHTS